MFFRVNRKQCCNHMLSTPVHAEMLSRNTRFNDIVNTGNSSTPSAGENNSVKVAPEPKSKKSFDTPTLPDSELERPRDSQPSSSGAAHFPCQNDPHPLQCGRPSGFRCEGSLPGNLSPRYGRFPR